MFSYRIQEYQKRKRRVSDAKTRIVFFCDFLCMSITNFQNFNCPDNLLKTFIDEYALMTSYDKHLLEDYKHLVSQYIFLASGGYKTVELQPNVREERLDVIKAIKEKYET